MFFELQLIDETTAVSHRTAGLPKAFLQLQIQVVQFPFAGPCCYKWMQLCCYFPTNIQMTLKAFYSFCAHMVKVTLLHHGQKVTQPFQKQQCYQVKADFENMTFFSFRLNTQADFLHFSSEDTKEQQHLV